MRPPHRVELPEDKMLRQNIERAERRTAPSIKVADEILIERLRQMEQEGWARGHDDSHIESELSLAAACYAGDRRKFNRAPPVNWPWDTTSWKPTNQRRDLVKAAALIVAEIERLDRLAENEQ